jgi:hypothetical protein
MWAGTATRYGLGGRAGGRGIESRWVAKFSTPVQTGPEVQPASYTKGAESFPGLKRTEGGADYTPHLEPKLNSRDIYLFPFWGGLFWGEI